MNQPASDSAIPISRLKTARLVLREIKLSDAEAIFAIFGDAEVTRYYDLGTMPSQQDAVRLIQRMAERFDLGGGVRWGIALLESDRIIGTVGLRPKENRHTADIGYDLARAYWGQGYMGEALGAVLQDAFNNTGIHRVEALVMPGNDASERMLRRLGFTAEGLLREVAFFKGSYQDLYCFSLLNHEFNRQRAKEE